MSARTTRVGYAYRERQRETTASSQVVTFQADCRHCSCSFVSIYDARLFLVSLPSFSFLTELRLRKPVLFLPFSTYIVNLYFGDLPSPPSGSASDQRQPGSASSSPFGSNSAESGGSAPSAVGEEGGERMSPFCHVLGCLGPCCSLVCPSLRVVEELTSHFQHEESAGGGGLSC